MLLFRRPVSRVHGRDPVEHDDILRTMSFVRESQAYPDIKVKRVLEAASWFYPNWNHRLAAGLIEEFALPMSRPVKKVSRGQHWAVGIVIGLASRAEITLFDEPYLGLDAVTRQIFYDRLLADYWQHPRTVLLSTHLIDEVANLLERVVVLNRGRIVVDAPADELRGRAVTVSGRASAVDDFIANRKVLSRQGVGSWTGPGYQVLITSFAVLSVVFLFGLRSGLIYRRFALIGTVAFFAVIALVLVGAVVLITWRQAWPRVWGVLVDLNILGASLLVALVALMVSLGGYLTIWRITSDPRDDEGRGPKGPRPSSFTNW